MPIFRTTQMCINLNADLQTFSVLKEHKNTVLAKGYEFAYDWLDAPVCSFKTNYQECPTNRNAGAWEYDWSEENKWDEMEKIRLLSNLYSDFPFAEVIGIFRITK